MIAGQDHNYKKVELAGDGVDSFTGAQGVISEPHLMTHNGLMFHSSRKISGVLNAEVSEFLLAVPALTWPHIHRLRMNVGSGDIDVVQYEGTTTSADGTAVDLRNTNRASTKTPGTVVTHTPTVSAVGTEIHRMWLPPTAAGVGQSLTGISDAEAGEEWVLKPSTKYLTRITNNSGSTIDIWIELMLYETNAT